MAGGRLFVFLRLRGSCYLEQHARLSQILVRKLALPLLAQLLLPPSAPQQLPGVLSSQSTPITPFHKTRVRRASHQGRVCNRTSIVTYPSCFAGCHRRHSPSWTSSFPIHCRSSSAGAFYLSLRRCGCVLRWFSWRSQDAYSPRIELARWVAWSLMHTTE